MRDEVAPTQEEVRRLVLAHVGSLVGGLNREHDELDREENANLRSLAAMHESHVTLLRDHAQAEQIRDKATAGVQAARANREEFVTRADEETAQLEAQIAEV